MSHLDADVAAPVGTQASESTTWSLADALAAVEALLRKYVVLARAEAYVAVALWIAHTHALEYAEATPYLAVGSPEKQSGKTRLLELLRHLAHACPGILITPTAATLYRSLEASPGATLMLDELDAIFRDRSDRYEEVRAVINAGHRRGATVPRGVPGPKNTWLVKQFAVFAPKALAGIGRLPDTIADRSIPVRMVRRKRTEPIERFRERLVRPEAEAVAAELKEALVSSPPELSAHTPDGLSDRAADGWEPLLAIADRAGGTWPTRARTAALVLQAHNGKDESLGLRLLADIRRVFTDEEVERITSAHLIEALRSDDEGPWASERYALTAHRLARLLEPYEIAPKQLRIDGVSLKGYAQEWFVETWERFLDPPQTPVEVKHRNSSHGDGFAVSDPVPPEGDLERDWAARLIEDDYPQSAWDPGYGEDAVQ